MVLCAFNGSYDSENSVCVSVSILCVCLYMLVSVSIYVCVCVCMWPRGSADLCKR